MQAFENILEQALAQVLDGQPVGVDITFAEVSAAWARLGLRKSDLHETVRDMVERQYLIARNLSGSLGFALTEDGALHFSVFRHRQDELQAWLKQRREIQPQDPKPDLPNDHVQRRQAC